MFALEIVDIPAFCVCNADGCQLLRLLLMLLMAGDITLRWVSGGKVQSDYCGMPKFYPCFNVEVWNYRQVAYILHVENRLLSGRIFSPAGDFYAWERSDHGQTVKS